MKSSIAYEELKYILDNVRTPELLNDHPWTSSLVVVQGVLGDKFLSHKAPGYQLISVLSTLFRQMMPSTPPRRGKRLDTRWCQFGMLAAEYFAPFLYGTPYSTSLRDAWGRIDQAIPFFVFGKSGYDLPESEVSRYLLFADDTEPAPNSTLSDWFIKGVQRLAELFISREQKLSQELSKISPVLQPNQAIPRPKPGDPTPSGLTEEVASPKTHRQRSQKRRWFVIPVCVILLGLVSWIGFRVYRIYQAGILVRDDLQQLEGLLGNSLDISTVDQVRPLLTTTRQDLAGLKSEVQPFLWMGKWLGWVPVYGGDIASVEPIFDTAYELVFAADGAYQGISPILQTIHADGGSPLVTTVTTSLIDAQPQLSVANQYLDEAKIARNKIDDSRLSPEVRALMLDKVDPAIQLLGEELVFVMTAPKLLGATSAGPQTYLLLLQNEDELRATGGFITGVGTVVIRDGNLLSFEIMDSAEVDDFTKPYPPAPWQLQQYMNSRILLLRDSNWSPDFPTSAAMAEFLYAYTRYHTADGVIALDQEALRSILTVVGPVEVEGASNPIAADNVIPYMRQEKYEIESDAQGVRHRKTFMGRLGEAILEKIQSKSGLSWSSFLNVFQQALNERHILLQLDDPGMTKLLVERNWDGAVRTGNGDFLLVTDTNVGFNKTNAVVDVQLTYNVDLTDVTSPMAKLTVVHTNNTPADIPCRQWWGRAQTTYAEQINHCYWDYMRIYLLKGTQLLDATPQAVPAEWTILNQAVPARVDLLDDLIDNALGYGTFLVVPGGTSLETSFQFLLPNRVVSSLGDSSSFSYELRLQKQAGTKAIPVHVCVRLPAGGVVENASLTGNFDAGVWCADNDLRTDINLKLTFSAPAQGAPVQVQDTLR
jgi:hypothetical protein